MCRFGKGGGAVGIFANKHRLLKYEDHFDRPTATELAPCGRLLCWRGGTLCGCLLRMAEVRTGVAWHRSCSGKCFSPTLCTPPTAPPSPVNLRDARKDNPPSPFVLEHAAIAPGTEHLRGFTPASWQGFWTRGASRGRRRRIERPEGRRDFPGPAAPRGSEAGAEPSRCAVPHAIMVLRALGAGTEDPELRALSSRRGLDPDAHCRAAPVASMPRFPGARVGSTSVKAQEPSRAGGPFGLVLSCLVLFKMT